jgi:multiple sugar transport system substrate-binding protein
MRFAKKMFVLMIPALFSAALLFAGGEQQGSGGTAAPAGGGGGGVNGDTLNYDLGAPVNGGRNITIEFWTQNELHVVHEKLAADYTKVHPNVKINITTMAYGDLFQKLPIALQTGTGPDIFHMHNSYDGLFGPYLAPYPQDVLPLDQLKADFTQIDPHVKDGKIYYMDMGVMTSGIFYNKKMWREAGLTEADIPKTWDQFVQVAKKLTQYDSAGNITREGFSNNGYEDLLTGALTLQSGRYFFDANNRPVVNTDVWEKNLKFVLDFYTVHKTSSIQFPPFNDAFNNQQGAMIYCWGWIGALLSQNPDLEWGYFNLPTWDGKPAPAYDRNNGETILSVSNSAKKEAQAVGFDILKYFLCRDDLLVEMDMLLNIVPTKKSLAKNPAIQSNIVLGTQSSIVDRTIWPGPVPDPFFIALRKYAVEPVILNSADIRASLAEAQRMMETDFVKPFPNFKSLERAYAHANEMR